MVAFRVSRESCTEQRVDIEENRGLRVRSFLISQEEEGGTVNLAEATHRPINRHRANTWSLGRERNPDASPSFPSRYPSSDFHVRLDEEETRKEDSVKAEKRLKFANITETILPRIAFGF